MTNHGWEFQHDVLFTQSTSLYQTFDPYLAQSSHVVLGLMSWRIKCHTVGKGHFLLFLDGQISRAMLDFLVRKISSHICCTAILYRHFSNVNS